MPGAVPGDLPHITLLPPRKCARCERWRVAREGYGMNLGPRPLLPGDFEKDAAIFCGGLAPFLLGISLR